MFFRKPIAKQPYHKIKKIFNSRIDSLATVIYQFSPYLTCQENLNFLKLNSYSATIYKDNVWRSLHLAHVGPFYYAGDYKQQYIAGTYLQYAQKYKDTEFMTYCIFTRELSALTKVHLEKSWGLYYGAEATHNLAKGYDLGLEAVKANEPRAAKMVIERARYYALFSCYIPDEYSQKIIAELKQRNLTRALCFAYAIDFYRHSQQSQKELALTNFFSSIQPLSKDVDAFLLDIIYLARLLHLETTRFLSPHRERDLGLTNTKNAATVTEAILLYLVYESSSIFKSLEIQKRFFDYLQRQAELNNGIAAYCLGNYYYNSVLIYINSHTQENTNVSWLAERMIKAKDYYLKAYELNEYRSVAKLGALLSLRKDLHLLEQSKLTEMIEDAIKHLDPYCIFLATANARRQRNWHQNPEIVWTIKHAAWLDMDEGKNKRFLEQAQFLVDKSVYVDCALALHYGRLGDKEKSVLCYAQAHYIDPDALEKYIKVGKKAGLWNAEFSHVWYELTNTVVDNPYKRLRRS